MVVTLEARQHDQTGESVPTIAMPSDLQPVSEKRYLSSQMGQLSRPVQGPRILDGSSTVPNIALPRRAG